MEKTVILTLPNDTYLNLWSLRVIYREASYIHTLTIQLNCGCVITLLISTGVAVFHISIFLYTWCYILNWRILYICRKMGAVMTQVWLCLLLPGDGFQCRHLGASLCVKPQKAAQFWFKVGPTSETMAQSWINISWSHKMWRHNLQFCETQ